LNRAFSFDLRGNPILYGDEDPDSDEMDRVNTFGQMWERDFIKWNGGKDDYPHCRLRKEEFVPGIEIRRPEDLVNAWNHETSEVDARDIWSWMDYEHQTPVIMTEYESETVWEAAYNGLKGVEHESVTDGDVYTEYESETVEEAAYNGPKGVEHESVTDGDVL